jgi:uncharacterized Zn-finger protein
MATPPGTKCLTRKDYRLIRKTSEKRGTNYLWEVECPYCGKVFKAIPCLLGTYTKSCGCQRGDKPTDYSLPNFRLLRRTDEKRYGRYLWEVECPYCAKVFKAIPGRLGRSKGAKSCGCRNGNPLPKDYSLPNYKLLRRTDEKKGSAYLWEVECPYCGDVFKEVPCVLGKNKISCGCMAQHDYTGEYVNYLYVIRNLGYQARANLPDVSLYECVCTYLGCGKTVRMTSHQLAQGVQSCGCKRRLDRVRRHLNKYKET